MKSQAEEINNQESAFDLRGYEIARSQFFDVSEKLTVFISVSHIRFNANCITKMGNTSYIEMLIEPINGFLAIRKSDKTVKNSISWITFGKRGNSPKNICGKAFLKTIFEILSWNTEYKYRLSGTAMNNENNESAIIFNLREPEVLIPESIINEGKNSSNTSETSIGHANSTSKLVCAYPKEWTDNFGNDYYSQSRAELTGDIHLSDKGKTFISEEAYTTDKTIIKKTINSILSLSEEEKNDK